MYSGSGFTVAGMSQSTTGHSPNVNAWGTTSTSGPSFGDSLSQSRSQYQSGYLVSSQLNNAPQGNQRVDDIPIVQTKARINQLASRGSTSEFGMDSMFKSSRQRTQLADEDAPPTSSVNDIPTENFNSARFQPKASTLENSMFPRREQRAPASSTPQSNQQPIYVIVFGYPVDRYTSAVEYFKSLGSATEPDSNADIVNCFRIGYHDAADALRAVRKNGEVLGGSWMVGAKFADPFQAEMTFGQAAAPINTFAPSHASSPTQGYDQGDDSMSVDPPAIHTPTHIASGSSVGTPIRLAPSTSAFRKSADPTPTAQTGKGWPLPSAPAMQHSQSAPIIGSTPATKGVLGQVSDLIFGW